MKKNISMSIGMVYQCNKNQQFGIIISLFGDNLYYFDKEANSSINRYDLVSYIRDPLDSNKAKSVIEIKKIKKTANVFDYKEVTIENAIMDFRTRMISFLAQEEGAVYYTAIPDSSTHLAIELYERSILNKKTPLLSISELGEKIEALKKYVNHFDEKEIIKTYTVIHDGHIQTRVGRDDFFHTSIERCVQSDDPYIKSILPIGEERNHYHYGPEDEEYHYLDNDATMEGQKMAISNYRKEDHFVFLLNDFISEFYSERDRIREDISTYEQLFNLYKVNALIKNHNFQEHDYKRLVERYNRDEKLFMY